MSSNLLGHLIITNLQMKLTLDQKKAKLLESIEKLDAMKSHKKFVVSCLKARDYTNLAWFFWQSFMFNRGKRRHSVAEIWNALPMGMRRFIEYA
jgi:hypothetical protein